MVQVDALIFNEIPKGKPIPGQTLKKVQQELDLDASLQDGEILVKTTALSLDPYQRGRMRPEEVESCAFWRFPPSPRPPLTPFLSPLDSLSFPLPFDSPRLLMTSRRPRL